MIALLLATIQLVGLASAIPLGFTTYFDAAVCPAGWHALSAVQGRLIVSVTSTTDVGITVNEPLKDQENRQHSHGFTANVNVPAHDISAVGCCNNDGGQHGVYGVTNNTQATEAGYPFTQVLLCTFDGVNDTAPIAFGTVAYFDPDVQGCPPNWVPVADANGRFLVPGYPQGGALPSPSRPLASGEDRSHTHDFAITIATTQVSYAAIGGCCDSGPSQFQSLIMSAGTEPAAAGLPYIQLLTCTSQSPTFSQTLPTDAMVFNSLACPPGWTVENDVSGRLLVALPNGGSPGATFGGKSIAANATGSPSHKHRIAGSLNVPSVGVGAIAGCCADGYLSAGSFPYEGHTFSQTDDLPYTMMPLCRSASSKKVFI